MTPLMAAKAFVGLVVFGALVAFWLGPLRWFATDWARERMFAARENLFDMAVMKHVSFDDPAYHRVRRSINNSIRFAHSVTLSRFLFHFFAGTPKELPSEHIAAREMADRIADDKARAVAHASLDEVDNALMILLLLKSPFSATLFLLILLTPVVVAHRGRFPGRSRLREKLRPFADQIQIEAALC